MKQRLAKPKHTRCSSPVEPGEAVYHDAIHFAQRLIQQHRTYYKSNRRAFRLQVKKAHSRVFRLKPGPKADARIARAAQERARGTEWTGLYPKFIDGYQTMSEFTRTMADEGFRRKVNRYLQRHPRLRKRWAKGTGATVRNANRRP